MFFLSRFKKKPQSVLARHSLVSAVVVGAVFGLAAGVVGMLMTIAYLPSVYGQDLVGYGLSIEPVVVRARLSPEMVVRGLSGPTALFYRTSDLDGIVRSGDSVGGGVVLTADGWLLTHVEVLAAAGSNPEAVLSALVDGRSYEIERVVVDSYSGAVFVKVDGSGLPVVAIGSLDREPAVGDSVISFDRLDGLRTAAVTAWGNVPVAGDVDAYRSSESVQRVMLLAESDGFQPGSAIFGTDGEVTGIFVGRSGETGWAVPLSAFSRQVSSVLRGDGTVRPYLGVRYVDLSEQPLLVDGTDRGVRLSSYGQLAAVIRQSPAAAAGLREGDLVLAVDGESVTVNRPLSALLAEYSPDDMVTLSVDRNGSSLELEVTLGQVSAP